MRQRATMTMVAGGLIIGATIGILVGVLFPDDLNFALAMVVGAALGIIVGAVLDLLNRSRQD